MSRRFVLKRLLSFILALAMLVSLSVVYVYAEGGSEPEMLLDIPDDTNTEDPADEGDSVVTDDPNVTGDPDVTDDPNATGDPDVTDDPNVTGDPGVTDNPDDGDASDITEDPAGAGSPGDTGDSDGGLEDIEDAEPPLDGGVETTLEADASDGAVVSVTGVFPDGASVAAYPVEIGDEINGETVVAAYDIVVYDGDGNVIEDWSGDDTYKVSIILPEPIELEEDCELNVVYVPEEAGAEPETVSTMAVESEVVEVVEFEVEHFSVYAITATATNSLTLTYQSGSGTTGSITLNRQSGVGSSTTNPGEITVATGDNVTINANGHNLRSITRSSGTATVNSTGSGTTSVYTISSITSGAVFSIVYRTSGNNTDRTVYLKIICIDDSGFEGTQPATIEGDKSATRISTVDTEGEYEVEVVIRSEPEKVFEHTENIIAADVIIAIDLSNSMDTSEYFSTAKSAIGSMIDKLLPAGSSNTVSIAGYASGSTGTVVETTYKAYHIYQYPTQSAATAKSSIDYASAWRMRGASQSSGTDGSYIRRGGTNSEAGFVAAAELVESIKSTPGRDPERQIVVVYISDGEPTRYYTYNANGTRSETGSGNSFETQGMTNTINASKTLGDNVTVFTVGIGLGASGANTNAVNMMEQSASSYRDSSGTSRYFYTDTTAANLLERLSELGVKLSHTKITNNYHTEFTLVDPMSEYVELLSSLGDIKVQYRTPTSGWIDVPTGEYEITITKNSDGRDVITLHVEPYYGTQYTYRMVYRVEVLDYQKIHKDGTTYGSEGGAAKPVFTDGQGDGVVLNGYTYVTSDLVTDKQEIAVPVGYRNRPTGSGDTMDILKVDENGDAIPQVGVTFKLVSQTTGVNDITVATQSSGRTPTISFPRPANTTTYTYYLYETTGPAGYDWLSDTRLAVVTVTRRTGTGTDSTSVNIVAVGYSTNVTISTSNNKVTVIVENPKTVITEFDIILKKVNEAGDPLAGASFKLDAWSGSVEFTDDSKLDDANWTQKHNPADTVSGLYATADPGGDVTIEGLTAGMYRLTEISSAPGYILYDTPVYFTVDAGGEVTLVDGYDADIFSIGRSPSGEDPLWDTLIVTNYASYELPETGGIGTGIFTGAGMTAIIGGAGALTAYGISGGKKRRRYRIKNRAGSGDE